MRATRCKLSRTDVRLKALLLGAIIRLAPISIKFPLKWTQHSINRLPRRDKGPTYHCEIAWLGLLVFVCTVYFSSHMRRC